MRTYNMHKLLALGLFAFTFAGTNPALAQNIQSKDLAPAGASASNQPAKAIVGSIKVVTGLVNLQTAEGKNKFASAGTKLNVGDVINTQAKSTAVLEFVDTTQVALRPKDRKSVV